MSTSERLFEARSMRFSLLAFVFASLVPNGIGECVTSKKCEKRNGECVSNCVPGHGQKCKPNWCRNASAECACLYTKCPQTDNCTAAGGKCKKICKETAGKWKCDANLCGNKDCICRLADNTNSPSPSTLQAYDEAEVTYPASLPYTTMILNPERGMYRQYSYYSSSRETTLLNAADLHSEKLSTGTTTILRLFYLDEFLDKDISQEVLDDMKGDFAAMRIAGVKAVVRLAYKNNDDDPSPTEPPLPQLLSHIAQVSSILSAAQDVIFLMQAGFVGPWGEWHSSTHFHSGSTTYWDGLDQVLKAVLDAVPQRIVQIRTPLQKMNIYQSIELPEPTSGHVINGGMEDDVASSWSEYMSGYSVSTESNSGKQSIMVSDGAGRQWIELEAPSGYTVEISGYSKSVATSVDYLDYCIYVDVTYSDGTYLWAQRARFIGGTSTDWEYSSVSFTVPEGKSVAGISLYTMYRNDPLKGRAYFDDIEVKVYGLPLSIEGGVLDERTAFTGSYIARTGHHNDCFLASDTDIGTYSKDDQSEYPYLAQDTKYTAMGGETCKVNPPRSDCSTAMYEMELFHYSYLNSGYHPGVLAGFESQGCMNEIAAKLGYRLVLLSGTFPNSIAPAGNIRYSIAFENEGYAAPINRKRVQLVLRESNSGLICATTDMQVDTRTWYGGGDQHTLYGTATLPSDIPSGTYDLFLNIADADENLKTNVGYKIKVANAGGLNEPDSGLIHLQHSILVAENEPSGTQSASGPQFAVSCGVEKDILPPPPVVTNPNSYVTNGSFEGEASLSWSSYNNGYSISTVEAHSGSQSIEVTNGNGARQSVLLNAPKDSTIQISGYSKSLGVSPGLGADYAIYADVQYADGSHLWGQTAEFAAQSSPAAAVDWEYKSYSFLAEKNVHTVTVHALYRNDPAPAGLVFFDDVELLVTLPLVTDGGFESDDVESVWSFYGEGGGYTVIGTDVHSGARSIKVTNGAASQWVTLDAGPGSTVKISGCSKAVGTSTDLWDYSIYADASYTDGTSEWGIMAKFDGGTTDWVCSEKSFVVPAGKTMQGMTVYTMYRNDPLGGEVYFDDVKVMVEQ